MPAVRRQEDEFSAPRCLHSSRKQARRTRQQICDQAREGGFKAWTNAPEGMPIVEGRVVVGLWEAQLDKYGRARLEL